MIPFSWYLQRSVVAPSARILALQVTEGQFRVAPEGCSICLLVIFKFPEESKISSGFDLVPLISACLEVHCVGARYTRVPFSCICMTRSRSACEGSVCEVQMIPVSRFFWFSRRDILSANGILRGSSSSALSTRAFNSDTHSVLASNQRRRTTIFSPVELPAHGCFYSI